MTKKNLKRLFCYTFHLIPLRFTESSALKSHNRYKGIKLCHHNSQVIWSVSVGCECVSMIKHNRNATSLLVFAVNGPDVWNPPYGGGTDPPSFHSYSKIKTKMRHMEQHWVTPALSTQHRLWGVSLTSSVLSHTGNAVLLTSNFTSG